MGFLAALPAALAAAPEMAAALPALGEALPALGSGAALPELAGAGGFAGPLAAGGGLNLGEFAAQMGGGQQMPPFQRALMGGLRGFQQQQQQNSQQQSPQAPELPPMQMPMGNGAGHSRALLQQLLSEPSRNMLGRLGGGY